MAVAPSHRTDPPPTDQPERRARPIRLAHVFSSDLGIRASLPFFRPCVERGWEVTVICPPGPNVELAHAAGISWLPFSIRRRIEFRGDIEGTFQLWRYLRDGRFDIVHTHNIKVGLIGRVVATAARVPAIVHTMHGLVYSLDTPFAKRWMHAGFEWIASRRVDAILSQSEEDRRTVLETHVVGPDRVTVIGNGIDLSRFHPEEFGAERRAEIRSSLGVGASEVLFLSAGRLVREKGFGELLEAAVRARQQKPNIRVAVAGPLDDERPDSLGPQALDRAREGGVLVLGERDDMPALYAAADVVVLTPWSRGEGLPRVLMEGAAMGRPLLTTDVRGCREIVRDSQNGRIVPEQDVPALTSAMLALAGDPEGRARMGHANLADARDLYDVQRVALRVVDVYDRILAAREKLA